MPEDTLFKIIFLVGMIIIEAIRAPHRRRNRQQRREKRMAEQRIQGAELVVLYGGLVGMYLLPALYIFTPWLDFASCDLPAWAGIIGAVLMAASIWVLWRAQLVAVAGNPGRPVSRHEGDISLHPSSDLRFRPVGGHCAGVIAPQLAGLSGIVVFLLTYFLRVPREEQMMVERYGEAYRAYRARTGGVIPRLM